MKKMFAVALAGVLVFSLAACSKKDAATPTDTTEATTAIDGMEVIVGYDEDGKAITEIVPTSNFQGTTDPMSEVTVVIPYNYIYSLDAKYQNDIQLYCTDNGFASYTADEAKGTVSFKMTASVYNTFLSEKRWELTNIFISLVNSNPFLDQCIANNIEYTDITLRVDKEEYEKDTSSGMVIDYIGSLCMNSYQIFTTRTDYHCNIKIVDKETGEVIEEFSKTSVFSS